MKVKRIQAPDMRQAIRKIREELGPDAVILSNKRSNNGIEVIAALDYDEQLFGQMVEDKPSAQYESDVENKVTANDVHLTDPLFAQNKPVFENHILHPSQQKESGLLEMRQEIKSLRGMLEKELGNLSISDLLRRKPATADVLSKFGELGFELDVARTIVDQLDIQQDPEQAWWKALGLLARQIKVTDDDILSKGGIVAVFGATGVGKTTTIAKLAARYSLRHGKNSIALISTDSYRIAAHEQLRTYGQLLGIPVFTADTAEQFKSALDNSKDKRLVLIDTVGLGFRDQRLQQQTANILNSSTKLRAYLVLAANTHSAVINEEIAAFEHAKLSGCILTKLDETIQLGAPLSAILKTQMPLAYVSDGQRVPEDLHPARAHTLLSKVVASSSPDDVPITAMSNRPDQAGDVLNAHL